MTDATDPVLGFLARRSVAVQWRGFIRCLLETLDANLDPAARDDLLRTVGGRMALLFPLPACATLGELEARINDVLATTDWGFVQLSLGDGQGPLRIRHAAAPLVATDNDADGAWLGAVLEGLFGAWIGQQGGAVAGVQPRVTAARPGLLELTYGG